jgi:NAD+ synthase
MPLFSPESSAVEISEFLRSYTNGRNMVVGISGGIDSSVVLMLCKLVDEEKVIPVFMPDCTTPTDDYRDISILASRTGIEVTTVNIDPVVKVISEIENISDRRILGNVKSRTRMIILYSISNSRDGMVVGTTNRTEYLTGYFTKFGDGGCDLEPIAHLYKNEVRKLAAYLGVPKEIIQKKPSAGLWEGQTDEEELGISYDELDSVLVKLFDQGKPPQNDLERKFMDIYSNTRHKRMIPPSISRRDG